MKPNYHSLNITVFSLVAILWIIFSTNAIGNYSKESINSSFELLNNTNIISQDSFDLSFAKTKFSIHRKSKSETIEKIKLNIGLFSKDTIYDLKINVDNKKTSLLPLDYKIELTKSKIIGGSNSEEVNCYITIPADSIPDRDRTLRFSINVTVNDKDVSSFNKSKNSSVEVEVKGIKSLTNLNYLAHLGTNFDLVDGLQPKKLFFATNFFIPNKRLNFPATGFYFSLYGNRSFSSVDTLFNISRITNINELNDSTMIQISETVDRSTLYHSDNLGAQVVLPISIFDFSRESNSFQVWLAPTTEFIWRRSITEIDYSNSRQIDTNIVAIPAKTVFASDRNNFSIKSNQFEFNYGLGFFLNHTNENISIRFNCSVGRSTPYIAESSINLRNNSQFVEQASDTYFSGKLWIIEPTSGLTIQAEVFNRKKSPTPYYVVTVSKAITMKSLGKLLQPLSNNF